MLCLPGIIAAVLSIWQIWPDIPPIRWWHAMFAPDFDIPGEMVLHYITLPRISASLLAGASLAFSGMIFQQILRNPLAEPSTVGVSAGAALALKASALLVPGLALPAIPVAASGAAVAVCLTLALASYNMSSPLQLILAGLVVGLFCGVINSVLMLFFHEELRSIFLWNAGSLLNIGWEASTYMAPALLICAFLTTCLIRPLELLSLEDDSGRSLGVPIVAGRLSGLLISVVLASVTVASVGVIGFVGIAAPVMVRLAGIRTFRRRMIAAPFLGAVLLWLTDQLAQINPLFTTELPAGVMMAILGGATMLWMLSRLRDISPHHAAPHGAMLNIGRPPRLLLAALAVLLVFVAWGALSFGRSVDGWLWQGTFATNSALEWRWLRVTAAALAGAMLASAGMIIQRVTANPMASPEVLGVSSGAAFGVALLFLFDTGAGHGLRVFAASGGAFLTMVLTFALIRKATGSPERMLLTGVALATVCGAFLSAITVRFDPRISGLLSWLAGSTYSVTTMDVFVLIIVAFGFAVSIPFIWRWLEILPQGDVTARQVGVNVGKSRLTLLLIAALLTGTAVLTIGPLSFIGLIAPHLARMSGCRAAGLQLTMSAVLGALIMVTADWLGRTILFPYEIPAGMLAAVIGMPYFIWLIWRRSQRA